MQARHFDLVLLAMAPGLPPRERRALLTAPDLGAVLARPTEHEERLSPRALAALQGEELRRAAQAELELVGKRRVHLVGFGDPDYPQLLAATADPPPLLWVRGTLRRHEDATAVAMVGSRHPTAAGSLLARTMARELAGAGLSIVSGLALGIDGEAHRGALQGGGRTIAVLGSGLDRVYPSSHAALAEQVAASGALVSEFPLATPPQKFNFPRRNRVIAGWSPALVVVEAAQRSGALVTARLALEEGREVMAVPGHPSCETAAGTNALIRDGAVLVRGAADVAEQLGRTLPAAVPKEAAREPLLAALRADAPASLDELQRRSGVPVPELLQRLTQLELEHKVQRLPGALFVRAQ